jgi:CheY-like chemotaxis protein
VQIGSGLGESTPISIIVLPVLFEGQVNAVIELASFSRLSTIHQVFLDQLTESIGIVVNTIAAGMRTESLLKQSQSLTQELQSQQEELRETNERLERQAATLRESEERLKLQQEELQQTNEELEEKAKLLEVKNREVEFAKGELEEKAEQLALTSKYKSEFLANMSHELRTPLNSLLILSRMLSDNSDGNLQAKQVEMAKTIHGSGADLLGLINDILDLSKIESGTIAVEPAEVPFVDLRDYVEQNFRHVAAQKGIAFAVELCDSLTQGGVYTDPKRLQQILKNLLSNAFKFTEQGSVLLRCQIAVDGWSREVESLSNAGEVIAFSVHDTGIGIPRDKQRIIFEAFQQADGTTSRKYGGTGLGLSISREISRLLGGEIRVSSAPGEGSVFTLYVPRVHRPQQVMQWTQPALVNITRARQPDPVRDEVSEVLEAVLIDDRDEIGAGDRALLIVEDDPTFAPIVLDCARARGWKGVVATHGAAALAAAVKYRLGGIALDLRLPDVEGWNVLDRLKHDPRTRHIPVTIMSAEPDKRRALRMGAVGFVDKPASVEAVASALDRMAALGVAGSRRLLLIEDDSRERESLVELVAAEGTETVAVGSGREAIDALAAQPFQCVVVDLGLPDMSGFELLQMIKRREECADLPVIVYTGRELSRREETQLKRLSESIIVKDVRSPERLVEETSLYLHRPADEMSERHRRMLEELRAEVPALAGRNILVVDDDVRNIFAISSALERYQVKVHYAENGRDGLDVLAKSGPMDVVLMDIMMPELDGYEVMRRIRENDEWNSLPIIAVTAKAMRTDREKCIQAGASDYISKPVDMEQLVSMLRVWLTP